MEFKKTKYFNSMTHKEIELPFGTYYFCNNIVISELNEGVHFDWDKCSMMINKILEFYGEDCKIGFISNRINNYSVDPNNWVRAHSEYNFMIASAIIIYQNSSYKVATLEKYFSQKKLKRCLSLEEGITWLQKFKKLKV
ncbi:hypothetical protein [Algibacter lectus]|uniref:hypothetical protein n=1 Tax=Algibacter lectus TaxID=221126 RepID=UPI0026EAC49D|nr:hypothetical protein [Algibacter lectus]MDO7135731.1 hypothetical protein [Algibacter lectus]